MSFREPQARGNPSLWIREISVQHRHGYGDFQALFAVFGSDRTVMAVDDLFDDGKADARAVFILMLCPVEPVEQLGQLRRFYTAAIIFQCAEERRFRPLQLHPDHAAGGGMLAGVFQ